MEDLYKDSQNLPMDVTTTPSAITNNKLENGVAQLITAEAWNINSSDLMKKALSPLVTVPASSILTPPAESQSGVALKVAAAVLQPICLGDSPVVLPIHLQLGGSAAPQMAPNGNTPYVMTTQGPVPLPVLLEQHVFQHLNSPLVLPQGSPCAANPIHSNLFQGSSTPMGQPQLLDQKPSHPPQESVLPPVFQTPGFAAVLQDLFPSQGLGSSPYQPPPDCSSVPPQAFSSPLSPLVPPATLLVPYPVIVPLPVPVPIPIPIPIPVPQSAESKVNPDCRKLSASLILHSCKETQTPLEKEETKPFDFIHHRGLLQLNRHTVIKMSSENEVLDLSMKSPPLLKESEERAPLLPEDGALDLSITSFRKTGSIEMASAGHAGPMVDDTAHSTASKLSAAAAASAFALSKPHENLSKVESRAVSSSSSELLRQQPKWLVDQTSLKACEPSAGSNVDIVSTSQTTKVIVSVKDAVPAIFCGKIKGLSGVSTKNFSFKNDKLQDSALQCYDVKNPPENRDNAEALRKPIKNRNVKLKKMNSQEIHILPIKKQRLAAFFPRK